MRKTKAHRKSLTVQVGLLYLFMNVVSISLFTYVVTNNQAELIADNTRFQARELMGMVVANIQKTAAQQGMLSPSPEEIKALIQPTLPEFVLVRKDSVVARTSPAAVVPQNLERNAAQARAVYEYGGFDYHMNIDKEHDRLEFYIPLVDFGNGDLVAVTSQSMDEIGRRFRDLYQSILFTVIALTLLHSIFGWIIHRRIIRPILVLYDATQKISAGDYATQVKLNRPDELGALGNSFNNMAQVIQETVLHLKHRMEEIERARQKIEEMAITDELTRLYNRRHLFARFAPMLAFAKTHERHLGVVLIDIDHFKSVNDNYGHQAGDAVLQVVAARLKTCLRTGDVLGRYGGEEIMALLPGSDEDQSMAIAESFRQTVGASPIQIADGSEIPVTISIGVTEVLKQMAATETDVEAHQLVEAADSAMYRAKHWGRNQVVFALLGQV